MVSGAESIRAESEYFASSDRGSTFLHFISDNILMAETSEDRSSFGTDYGKTTRESKISMWQQSPEGLDAALVSQYLSDSVR